MSDDRCELVCLDLPRAEAVRGELPSVDHATRAAERAKAMADPSRLRVAMALASGGALCGCDLAWICSFSPNLVSHHLRSLRQSGLAESRRDGRLVMYKLTPAGRTLLSAVVGRTAAEAAAAPGADGG